MNTKVPAVDLIRRPSGRSQYGRRPVGDVILLWTAPGDDSPTVLEVTEWERLNRIPVGTVVTVKVQGRELSRFDQPFLGAQEMIVMTGDTADEVDVVVGDERSDDGWQFGVTVTGATVAPARTRRVRQAPA